MEIKTVVDLISTLGFPIAAVIAMAWFIWKIYKKSETREDELRDEIRENQQINREAIATISKYADRLELIQTDIEEIKKDVIVISEKIS